MRNPVKYIKYRIDYYQRKRIYKRQKKLGWTYSVEEMGMVPPKKGKP